jgi:RND superfamily putative drug exporter
VAIAWLAIGSVAGPLSGKLSEVSSNDNASFLPASAESTLAANEQAAFAESNSLPVLIVIAREDGAPLTPEDGAAAAAFAQSIPALKVEDGTVADYLDPARSAHPVAGRQGAAHQRAPECGQGGREHRQRRTLPGGDHRVDPQRC